ncbi:MAG: response regulator [Lachnospiraceae bacterium]|nr:response regulator [Lachnospiraceae bacterium]
MAEKKKVLLLGDNGTIMDDIFIRLRDTYTLMSSSIRYEDMENHMFFFQPDAMILCIGQKEEQNMQKIITLKRKLTREYIAFGIIGSPEECERFQRMSMNMADIVMPRPIKMETIKEMINDFLQESEFFKNESSYMTTAAAEEAGITLNGNTRKHVLVIDDDPMMLKIVKDHLHDNYDVATAPSGKIAYKFLEKKHTDIILLDYQMPDEDGPTVLKNLRKQFDMSKTPVLFLTGVADREKIREALALKPQGYLLKPIDKEKLLGNLDKFSN